MQQHWDSVRLAAANANVNTSAFSASSTLPSIHYVSGRSTPSMPSKNHTHTPPPDNDNSASSDDEYGQIRLLSEHVEALSLATDGSRGFHGKSSLTGVLIQAAQTIPSLSLAMSRMTYPKCLSHRRQIFWEATNVRRHARCFAM